MQAAQSDIDCVLQIDNHIADAFVARADTISSLPEKRAALRQALAVHPANETALENLADTYRQYIPSTALNDKLTAHRSLKNAFDLLNSIRRKHLEYALTLLDKRRNLTQLWAWDYEALAKVEADLGLYAKAAADIEMAIRKLPTRFEFYERRYNYELSAKSASAETAMQHFLQGLRERAAYFARASNDEEALRAHVKLFQSAASARDRFGGDEAVANEVQLCIHMITVYLDRRFGRPVAPTWWAATMRNPLATKLEQRMAGEEAAKIGAGQ